MKYETFPFTIRQLQYVLAVIETRNFRAAAQRCHVSQPSLSAQVAEVERALGVTLFERDRRGVLLTHGAEALLEPMRALLLNAEAIERAARHHLDPLRGMLRLGILPTIAPYALPKIDAALRAHFPELRLQWSEGRTSQLVDEVQRGALDAAILAREAALGDLEWEVLGEDRFLVATAPTHPLGRGEGPVSLEALLDEEVMLLDEGHCLGDQARALCQTIGARADDFRATSMSTLVQMVAAKGLTLLPQMAVELETGRTPLLIRPLEDPAPRRTIVLARRKNSAICESLARLAAALRDDAVF